MGRSRYVNKRAANRKQQSAAQNPEFNKYRKIASRMADGSTSSGRATGSKNTFPLTEDNLRAFQATNELDLQNIEITDGTAAVTVPSDALSLDSEFSDGRMKLLKGYRELNADQHSVAETFATNFTNCTNASFNALLSKFDSTNAMQKELLSLLAAITEIINMEGKSGDNQDYLEKLLDSVYTADSVLALTAHAVLLYYSVRQMPAEALREYHSRVQKVIRDLLAKYLDNSNITFVRFLLKSYALCIQSLQPDDWELEDTKLGYRELLLPLIISSKSRIRKTAQQAITKLLSNIQVVVKARQILHPEEHHQPHEIVKLTSNFCIQRIKSTSGEDVTSALYILNLLKEVLPFLDTPELKRCCETMISLLLLGNVLIFTNCMQVLDNLFQAQSSQLTPDLNNKLLLALYDYAPEMSDEQPFLAWCSVMKTSALCALAKDLKIFGEHFLKIFGQLVCCFQYESHILRGYTAQSMNQLLFEAIKQSSSFNPSMFKAIGETLRSFLVYKHINSFKYLFRLLSTFFLLKGEQFDEIHKRIYLKIVEFKDACGVELVDVNFEKPVINLLRHHGPDFVFELTPLQVNDEHRTLKNVWLINTLKQLQNVPLPISAFNKHILPIADAISSDANNFVDEKQQSKDTNGWLHVHSELWSLLPTFLFNPSDLQTSFKLIAKKLGISLSQIPHTRPFVLRSLRQIINRTRNDEQPEIAKYCKNYIPILLNLYFSVNTNKAEKLAIYETLAHFVSITATAEIETYYDKAVSMAANEQNPSQKMLYLDILRLLVCHLQNSEKVIRTFDDALAGVTDDNKQKKEQKKALRLIEELLRSSNFQMLKNYHADKSENLYQKMYRFFEQKYTAVNIPAAQAAFVRILQHLILDNYAKEKISFDDFSSFIDTLIGILASKKSARLTQSSLGVMQTLIDVAENGTMQCIELLIKRLSDTNASFDHKSTILFMLHNIIISCEGNVPKESKSMLISALLTNLNSENRKMVQTILVFIKDLFKITSKDDLLQFISMFTDYLNSIRDPENRKFRFKIKSLIEKLLKKYGHELVYKLLDKKYHRLLKHLEKQQKLSDESTKLDRKHKRNEYDSDEEIEDDEQNENENRGKRKSSRRWQFDNDDEFEGLDVFNQNMLDKSDEEMAEHKEMVNDNEYKISKAIQSQPTNDDIIRIDKEGNLVEVNADDQLNNKPSSSKQQLDASSNLPMLTRKHDIELDDSSEDDDATAGSNQRKSKPQKRLADQIMDKYRRKRGIYRDTEYNGEAYRSKRAYGDMKKPNLPDPYSYAPLNRGILNKRKASKNQKKFTSLVKSAVRGASMGKKKVRK